MKKYSILLLSAAVIVLGVALYSTRSALSSLRGENRALRLQLEQAVAETPAQAEPAVSAPAPGDPAELIRLRGEVANLRREKLDAEKLRGEIQALRAAQVQPQPAAEPQSRNIQVPRARESWAFAGYTDPESAMQSVLWAGLSGNAGALLAGLSPDQLARMRTEDNRERTEAEVLERLTKDIGNIKSFQILKSQSISDDETVLSLYLDKVDGRDQATHMKMERIGGEWRLAGPYREPDSEPKRARAKPAN